MHGYHKLSVCNETQYLWRMITCSRMFEKYACQSIKTSHEKRLTLAFEKNAAAFFSGNTPHFAPCLLCYFTHLRSSLGHETLRFALGTLLKSLPECGARQESFNRRDRQNLGFHRWGLERRAPQNTGHSETCPNLLSGLECPDRTFHLISLVVLCEVKVSV